MQQENALIGVQIAAYYPDISLSALGGFESTMISQLFTTASRRGRAGPDGPAPFPRAGNDIGR